MMNRDKKGSLRYERRQIGSYFLSHFPAKLPQRTVANMMGISRTMVELIEREAAWKIVSRMRESMRGEM